MKAPSLSTTNQRKEGEDRTSRSSAVWYVSHEDGATRDRKKVSVKYGLTIHLQVTN